MLEHIEIACDEIDAAMFSGDSFNNEQNTKELEYYLDRWTREIENIREMNKENENVNKTIKVVG